MVLAVGVKYSEVSTANYAIPQHETVIHVDANPHNLGRNVRAHVAMQADANVFLTRPARGRPEIATPRRPEA